MVTSVATMVPLGSVVHVPVNESELVPMVIVVFLMVPSEPRVSVLLKLSLGDSTDELSLLEPDPELSPLDAPLLAPDESMLDWLELPPDPEPPGPDPPGPLPPGPEPEPPGPLPPPLELPPPEDPPPDDTGSSVEAMDECIEEPPELPPLEPPLDPPLDPPDDPPEEPPLDPSVDPPLGSSVELGAVLSGVPLSLVNASVV